MPAFQASRLLLRPLAVAALLGLACHAPTLALDYAASVFASGLNNPRGLDFGPDGALWVTEAGTVGAGGPSTVVRGQTAFYNSSGSVTRILGGEQSRVFTGLPSLNITAQGLVEAGPQDIAFDTSGALRIVIGAGLNPAVRFTDLVPVGYQFGRVIGLGYALDVSAHEAAHNPAGGPVDSNPWRIAPLADGGMLVTEAGGNALLRVGADGLISTLATFNTRMVNGATNDSVPTGLALGSDGAAYVGELTGFPFPNGSARILRVEQDGDQTVFASGFTMVVDIAFDATGALFVLEHDSNGLAQAGTEARLWKLAADGSSRELAWSDGLLMPSGLAIGPDGAIYISNIGRGDGLGEVLRLAPVPEPESYALMLAGLLALGLLARRGGGPRR